MNIFNVVPLTFISVFTVFILILVTRNKAFPVILPTDVKSTVEMNGWFFSAGKPKKNRWAFLELARPVATEVSTTSQI